MERNKDEKSITMMNGGTSLDFDAIKNAVPNGPNDIHIDEGHSDEGEEDEHEQMQRNEELKNLLTNAFDDLIDEDDSSDNSSIAEENDTSHDVHDSLPQTYNGDTLFSPLQDPQTPNFSQTSDVTSRLHRKHCVRFSPMESTKIHTYRPHSPDENEKRYLSSGLNSYEELEALYSARGAELEKLNLKCHELEHRVALLEGEKTGITVSLQNAEKHLRETENENWTLKSEIGKLKEQIGKLENEKIVLNQKLEGAENNILALERQILDFNVLDAKRRDENKQEYIFGSIKNRYENEIRTLKDELDRTKYELQNKAESYSALETKFRDLTEMHQRTLMERAEYLQEFNRALDQQRQLREQRDTLARDEISRAREEIERLKLELSSTDSIVQLGLNNNDQNGVLKSLKLLLDEKERENSKLKQQLEITQRENQSNSEKNSSNFREIQSRYRAENEKLEQELVAVKELYLNICREKDQIEDQLFQMSHDKEEWDKERQHLLSEISESHTQNEKNLEEQKKTLETNWSSRMELAIKENLTRARLEWLKESAQVSGKDEVEKSLGELQCLRDAMDALRGERDALQAEVHHLKQQMRHERHLMKEKFKLEKEELLRKIHDDEQLRTESRKSEELVAATAEAMSRLRQQCEEEKLCLITDYEKQLRSAEAYREKYKSLKKKVRDYQLYVNDKVERYKRERQQSEDYFRQAIAGLHFKVTKELETLQVRTRNEEKMKSAFRQTQGSTFTEMVENLQGQINRYVSSMSQFTQSSGKL